MSSNNYELRVIGMGPEFSKAQSVSDKIGRTLALRHSFFAPSGEVLDLVRRLRKDGFVAHEIEGTGTVEAVRAQEIEFDQLRGLVRDMCDLADKFAAQYDGWTLVQS